MAWDYNYTVNSYPLVGSALQGRKATSVRILPEVSPGVRDSTYEVASRHGAGMPSQHWYAPYTFDLEVTLPWGTPAEVYEARSLVLGTFSPIETGDYIWLERTAPHQGTVKIPVMVRRPPQTGQPRNKLIIPLQTLDPFWRATTQTWTNRNVTLGITRTGDAPVSDASFSFTGANGIQRVTHVGSGAWMELDANTNTTAIIVDLGAGTVTQGGAHVDSVYSSDPPWGIELYGAGILGGINGFTVTGGGTVTVTGYEKWL